MAKKKRKLSAAERARNKRQARLRKQALIMRRVNGSGVDPENEMTLVPRDEGVVATPPTMAREVRVADGVAEVSVAPEPLPGVSQRAATFHPTRRRVPVHGPLPIRGRAHALPDPAGRFGGNEIARREAYSLLRRG
jgi:hypothetical protein